MRGSTCGVCVDEAPESQRITLPSPQPFPCVVPRPRSPGEYRIVNEEPVEDSSRTPSTRRSGRVLRET